MDAFQLEIARFVARQAALGRRTTYQEVGEAVGWSHPTGRGLGPHLAVILHEMHERDIPPLTSIVVKRGTVAPSGEGLSAIRAVIGDRGLAEVQQAVFDYDWTTVSDLRPPSASLPDGRRLWLTSFWGFAPDQWGCIGFSTEAKRRRFLAGAPAGTLVAIYVTKALGPRELRGRVVGILEVSDVAGHAERFISGDRWAEKEQDPKSRGKWLHAVQVTRAWRIAPEQQALVGEMFPNTYSNALGEHIGSNGVPISSEETRRLLDLDVYEVPVYGQMREFDSSIQPLAGAIGPSRAVPPGTGGYTVGETDGPKYLYILRLKGDVAVWLGCPTSTVAGLSIIKVGFSKSPLARRDQIQSAYPRGTYEWELLHPIETSEPPPWPDAAIAIAGEDAMKARLIEIDARSLGGEYFLAEDWQIAKTWAAGKYYAELALSSRASAAIEPG